MDCEARRESAELEPRLEPMNGAGRPTEVLVVGCDFASATEDPFRTDAATSDAWSAQDDVFGLEPLVTPELGEAAVRGRASEEADWPWALPSHDSSAGIGEEIGGVLGADPVLDRGPIATLTLARLALSQGELEMAESTVLEVAREYGPTIASTALMEEIQRRRGLLTPEELKDRKIAALQGWLVKIKRAGERSALDLP